MDRDKTSQHIDSTVVNHPEATLTITSTAFANRQAIPQLYSCQGAGISPELSWTNIPHGARSLALIVEDPDAPSGMFVHWVVFNIPPTVTTLDSNQDGAKTLHNMARQGMNGARKVGWTAPCPPSGTHRYFFRLYALDTILSLDSSANRDDLLKAMQGHIVGEGTLMGTYSKS